MEDGEWGKVNGKIKERGNSGIGPRPRSAWDLKMEIDTPQHTP